MIAFIENYVIIDTGMGMNKSDHDKITNDCVKIMKVLFVILCFIPVYSNHSVGRRAMEKKEELANGEMA